MTIPIIIIQTSRIGFSRTQEELSQSGLMSDSYMLTQDPAVAESAVVPGERQMLITGSHFGSVMDAEEFIVRMRAKNPLLTTACFSNLDEVPSAKHFDVVIQKAHTPGTQDMCGGLISAMRAFRTRVASQTC